MTTTASKTSDIDQVALNTIWREHCKKEQRVAKLNHNFSIKNENSVNVYPTKPTQLYPKLESNADELQKAQSTLANMCSMKHSSKLPYKKFVLPKTANMEYGFFPEGLAYPNDMYNYLRSKCDVTQYADTYVTMTGQSPFVGSNAEPKKK